MTDSPATRWQTLRPQLEKLGDGYPAEAIELLRADPAGFAPLLVAELQTLAADPRPACEDPDYVLQFHLLSLLAEWRTPQAWGPLLQLLQLDEESEHALFGMDAGELLASVLATLCPGDAASLGQLQALIADPAISPWLRLDGIEALRIRHVEGALDRDELIRRCRALLAEERARQIALEVPQRRNIVSTSLVGTLALLADAESEPLLADLFAEGLVDPHLFGREEKLRAWMLGEADPGEITRSRYLSDARAEMENWVMFQPAAEAPRAPAIPLGLFEPFVRETPKVGRNDPCPCGSGKKFKKCCGA